MAGEGISIHATINCQDDPNFATICSFLEKFGELANVGFIPFDELQSMLENTTDVSPVLVQLHIRLLRRVFKSIQADKWEKSLAKFGHTYNSQDGWEIERFGYKKAKMQTKLRLLKNLLESQFDYNIKFKGEVNKLLAEDLRIKPLGRDKEGQFYWYQCDPDANLRIYREDIDDEAWEVVASNREEMLTLIDQLQIGEVRKRVEVNDEIEEETNGNAVLTKEILLDTGKVSEEEDDDDDDEEEEESSEVDDNSNSNSKFIKVTNGISKKEKKLLDDKVDEKPMEVLKEKKKIDLESINVTPLTENENKGKVIISNNAQNLVETDKKIELKSNEFNQVDNNVKNEEDEAMDTDEIILKEKEDKTLSHNTSPLPLKIIEEKEKIPEIKSQINKKNNKDKLKKVKSDNVTKVELLKPEKLENQIEITAGLKEETTVIKSEEKPTEVVIKLEEEAELSIKLEEPTKLTIKIADDKNPENPESVTVKELEKPVELKIKVEEAEISTDKVEIEQIKIAHIDNSPKEDNKIFEVKVDIPEKLDDGNISSNLSKEQPNKFDLCNVNVKVTVYNATNPTKEEEKDEKLTKTEQKELVEKKKDDEKEEDLKLPAITDNEKTVKTEEEEKELLISEKLKERIIDKVESDYNSEVSSEALQIDEERIYVQEKEISSADDSQSEIQIPKDKSILSENKSPSFENINIIKPLMTSEEALIENALIITTSNKDDDGESTKEIPASVNTTDNNLKSPKENVPKIKESKNKLTNEIEEENQEQPKSEVPAPSPSEVSSGLNLVGYDESSSDNENNVSSAKGSSESEKIVSNNEKLLTSGQKRKAEKDLDANSGIESKNIKLDLELKPEIEEKKGEENKKEFNPIVGETIEEEVMIVTGKGEGVENEGGNENSSQVDTNNINNAEEEPEEKPKPRGRGRPGRPKKSEQQVQQKKETPAKKKETPAKKERKQRTEALAIEIPPDDEEFNGEPSPPVRQSRRIASIRQKEEEERRKLEAERLAQLKAAQIKKKLKEAEKSKQQQQEVKEQKVKPIKINVTKTKPPKVPKQTSKKKQKQTEYLPTPSASESDSDDGGLEADVAALNENFKKKRRKRRKNGKARKSGGHPWQTSSDEDEDEAVEEEEEEHIEEEEEEEVLIFNKSDHEFSPESDLGEDEEFQPTKHARTVVKDAKVDKYATTMCGKCTKGDHPEWILLCDSCDSGWHASCLKPQLWHIPEGNWFCPPCEHKSLIEKLNLNFGDYEKALKKRENEILRKQRLAFVGISLNNVLPSAPTEVEKEKEKKSHEKSSRHFSSSRRRRLLSDEEDEDIDRFIDDRGSSDDSLEEEEESEDDGYKLRARRANKGFSFKEYDDMINSALRADDEDEDVVVKPIKDEYAGSGKRIENIIKQNEEEERKKNSEDREDREDGDYDDEEEKEKDNDDDDGSSESEVDPKEIKGRELSKSSKRTRRRLNDLDATSEEDSDDDFQGSAAEDDEEEEEGVDEEDSEWSGGGGGDSDDSIARRGRVVKKKKGRFGRREVIMDCGAVRRSTRRKRSKIIYDESDEDEDGDENKKSKSSDKFSGSEEQPSGSGESGGSDSGSESDESWGKKKKKKVFNPPKSKLAQFYLEPVKKISKSKKKRKRNADGEEVDRAWNSRHGSKVKKDLQDEPDDAKRTTRGRKINFKDILDSGESDDDGNIRPKRRRILSDSDEGSGGDDSGGEASSSKKLLAENRAAEALYHEQQKQKLEKEELEQKEKEQSQPPILEKNEILENPPVPIPIVVENIQIETASAIVTKIPNPFAENIIISNKKEKVKRSKTKDIKDDNIIKVQSLISSISPTPSMPKCSTSPFLQQMTPSSEILKIPQKTSAPDSSQLQQLLTSSAPILAKRSSPTVSSQNTNPSRSSPLTASLTAPLTSHAPPPRPPIPHMQNIPPDISRLPASSGHPPPGHFGLSNPALRPFHPGWLRGAPQPPPYTHVPTTLGKPPPLTNSAFMPHQQIPRGGFPPNPSRIPSSIPPFHQFKRGMPPDAHLYGRMPQPFMPPHTNPGQMPPERFFAPPPGYYLPLPNSAQHPPQPIFAHPPFDFRNEEASNGTQPPPQQQQQQEQPPPSSDQPKSEQAPSQDGEFSGLVSYFSQRSSEDDLDT